MSDSTEGVFVEGRDGLVLVHAYLNENYGLADVAEVLQYGSMAEDADGDLRLTLTRKEIVDVQNAANAFSFDYDDGFVELCLDLARAAAELPGETLTFVEKL
jgi:hypothetical protein